MNEFEMKIIQKLQKAYESKKNNGDASATEVFHNSLAELTNENFHYYANSNSLKQEPEKRKRDKEYLIDFSISYEPEIIADNNRTINWPGFILILESEWKDNIEEVIYDFQKLGVIKSKYKIILFYIFNKKTKEEEKTDFDAKVKLLKDTLHKDLLYDGSTMIFAGNGNFDLHLSY